MKKIITLAVMACMMTSCAGLKPDEMVKTDIPDTTINTVSTSTGSWQSFIKQHWFAAAVSTVCIASLACNCWQYRKHSKTQIQTGQPAAGIEGQAQEIARLTADNTGLIQDKAQLQETIRQATEALPEVSDIASGGTLTERIEALLVEIDTVTKKLPEALGEYNYDQLEKRYKIFLLSQRAEALKKPLVEAINKLKRKMTRAMSNFPITGPGVKPSFKNRANLAGETITKLREGITKIKRELSKIIPSESIEPPPTYEMMAEQALEKIVQIETRLQAQRERVAELEAQTQERANELQKRVDANRATMDEIALSLKEIKAAWVDTGTEEETPRNKIVKVAELIHEMKGYVIRVKDVIETDWPKEPIFADFLRSVGAAEPNLVNIIEQMQLIIERQQTRLVQALADNQALQARLAAPAEPDKT